MTPLAAPCFICPLLCNLNLRRFIFPAASCFVCERTTLRRDMQYKKPSYRRVSVRRETCLALQSMSQQCQQATFWPIGQLQNSSIGVYVLDNLEADISMLSARHGAYAWPTHMPILSTRAPPAHQIVIWPKWWCILCVA
jgi:hypothetical protein